VTYSLGVDLGTTFVAAAIARPSGAVEMLTLSSGSVVAPAVVYLREDGVLVTGDAARRRAITAPSRVGREFKRRLGDPTPVKLGSESYSATSLLGALLSDVLRQASELEGQAPSRVVLTHPANWGPFRRGLFEDVPYSAGLVADTETVTEPEAAAAHYAASRRLQDGQVVAVYDLGGGTFDATVLRGCPQGIEILGVPEGIERLGGIDFDESILAYVNYHLDGALDEIDLTDPTAALAVSRLRQDCVQAKESLSLDTEVTIPVFLPWKHSEIVLNRDTFESMVRGPIESTITALHRTVRSADLQPSDLSAILLVGGSSRIPLVAEMVEQELGCKTVVDAHPKYTVALGAATLSAGGFQPTFSDERHSWSGGTTVRRDRSRRAGAPDPDLTAIAPLSPTANARADGGTAVLPPPPASPAGGQAPAPAWPQAPAAAGPPPLAPPAAAPRTPHAPQAPGHDAPPESAGYPGHGTHPAGPGQAGPVHGEGVQGDPGRGYGPPGAGGAAPFDVSRGRAPGGPPDRPARPNTAARPSGGGRRTGLLAAAAAGALVLVVLLGYLFWPKAPEPAAAPGPSPFAVPPAAAPPPTFAASVPNPTVETSFTVPSAPQAGEITPDGRSAWITSTGTNTIAILDMTNNAVVGSIPIAAGPPQFVTFTPDGRFAYVSVYDEVRGSGNAIVKIDTATRAVVATIPADKFPYAIAVSPNGQKLFVPNHDVNLVTVVDTKTNAIIQKIPVKPNPHSVAFSVDGRRAYVANHASNVVTVLDAKNGAILAEVPVGRSPHSISMSPDRAHLYVVNYDSDSVSVIDPITYSVTATIPVQREPQSVAFAPDSRHAYIVNDGSNTVSVIDTTTNQVTANVSTGQDPTHVFVSADGRHAYVTNIGSSDVTVLRTAN
jgi:YVTN family beta-propeller protein